MSVHPQLFARIILPLLYHGKPSMTDERSGDDRSRIDRRSNLNATGDFTTVPSWNVYSCANGTKKGREGSNNTKNHTWKRRSFLQATAGVGGLVSLSSLNESAAATPTNKDNTEQDDTPEQDDTLTKWVNPFIGTAKSGNTFPGVSVPFGMTQISPIQSYYAGYRYSNDEIRGFGHSFLSGGGCWEQGGLLSILPTVGKVTSTDHKEYASAFSHENETAEPGYYRVELSGDKGTTAELTATTRTSRERYTFPKTEAANIMVNTGQANSKNTIGESHAQIVDENTIEGFITPQKGYCGGRPYTLYFVTTFDRPFEAFGTWNGETLEKWSRDSGVGGINSSGGRRGAWVRFNTTKDQSVTATTAISYVDIEGARKNLEAEGDASFEDVRATATETWEEHLGRVSVTGGSDTQRTAFYSSLYRSMLAPQVGTDVDGRYTGLDLETHTATEFTYYQFFSLWDTYRTQVQLVALLAPEETRDMGISLLKIDEQAGWLPRWPYATNETNTMTGDPVTPYLVDIWRKGLLKGYEEETYAALQKNADNVPPGDVAFSGRAGNPWYTTDGYVPYITDYPEKPQVIPEQYEDWLRPKVPQGEAGWIQYRGMDIDPEFGASATLEYALADGVLATMAHELGYDEDVKRYLDRAQNYRNIFNENTGWFRARDKDGNWLGPDDPARSVGFHEGTAWQYMWLAQHDMPGLIELIGGSEEVADRLDHFFAYKQLLKNPEQTARNVWVSGAYGYYNKERYNPKNEPDLHSPYTYLWLGQPWKTVDVVRAALTLFTDEPEGMTGNDDLGTMSAWHVFSSIGIYPVIPGTGHFAITSPIFDRVEITLDESYYPAGEFVITAAGTTNENRYIQSAELDGQKHEQGYIHNQDIRAGRQLDLTLGQNPSTGKDGWATGDDAAPPSVLELNDTN